MYPAHQGVGADLNPTQCSEAMHNGGEDVRLPTENTQSPYGPGSEAPAGSRVMAAPGGFPTLASNSVKSECMQVERDLLKPISRKDVTLPESRKMLPLPRTGRVRISVGKRRPSGLRHFLLTGSNREEGVQRTANVYRSIKMELGDANQCTNGDANACLESGKKMTQSSSTDTDDDGKLIQRAMKAKEDMLRRKHETQTVISKKKSRVPGPRSGAASLKLLIDEAILSPGIGVLSLEYRGIKEIANLCSDGRIQWKDNLFNSPSAFSIFIKRLINPTRKADDGWKTVRFAGYALDHYKHLLEKKKSMAETGSGVLSHRRTGMNDTR